MAMEYDREWHWNEAVLTDFSPCHSIRLKSVSKIIEAPIELLQIERYVSIMDLDVLSPMTLNSYYYMYVVY
jgi:hypothetical protein